MKPKLTPLTLKDVIRIDNQEGLIMTLSHKINELIDYVTELEDRVRVLESNNNRGHR